MVNKLENQLNMSQAAPVTESRVGYSPLKKAVAGLALGTTLLTTGCAGYRVNGVDLNKPTTQKTGWCYENPKTCTAVKVGFGIAVIGGIAYAVSEANSSSSSSSKTITPVAPTAPVEDGSSSGGTCGGGI